jgi:drug/metabolite transporter (DMT)-like permease
MVTISLFNGNKLDLREWIGMIISFIGFVYLILPGVTAPSPIGFVLMALAGTAWGI